MKYADLHVHTYYSDSTFSPAEVVARAKKCGLAAIAICDHDSIDGISLCEAAASESDIEIVPSVELTAEKKEELEIHILGYFIDWNAGWFQARIKEVRAARIKRIYVMSEKLKGMGIDVDPEDVLASAGKGSVTRLHMARAIMKTGKIKNYKDVFNKYIGYLKPCYVSYSKFTPREAVEVVLKAGGVPVLAHPVTIGNDECVPELVEHGLRGIEAYHPEHDSKARRYYEELAKEHNLIVTGGSDCHGAAKGRVLMGSVRVPYEVVERLKEEAKSIQERN